MRRRQIGAAAIFSAAESVEIGPEPQSARAILGKSDRNLGIFHQAGEESLMRTGQQLIKEARSRITELDPSEVKEVLDHAAGNGNADQAPVILDVREQQEYEQGHLPGAVHVPRGHLETRIENAIPDRSRRVIAYCSTQNRSALAAVTMQEELGYEDVDVMTGGFTLWRDRGYPFEQPRKLTDEQKERYSRHLLIPEVGIEGQQKLLDAKVLLVGAGGLGSPAALYLAAAGVGTLGIVDDDVVDLTNLQRQVIHNSERIGEPKVESARKTIAALNPDVEVVAHQTRVNSDNVLDLIRGYDVIVDGADNFPTRYLLNDAAVRERKPVVHASILGFDGQLTVFVPYEGPCYRCLYPQPPPADLAPSCGANGVLGVLPGIMGLLQANETIKLIIGKGEPLVGRLLLFEALSTHFTELKVRRDAEGCPVCGDGVDLNETEFEDYEALCAAAG
jgi:molybdopterin/thiamine biosynthesis adenylyltransferase/rhodanese-related sulfurtransferase